MSESREKCPTGYKMGFSVTINCHTPELATKYDPESLRMLIADMLEADNEYEEDIDFTLEVKRTYEQL